MSRFISAIVLCGLAFMSSESLACECEEDGVGDRPVNAAFADVPANAKKAPGWRSSYANLTPVPVTEMLDGDALDDMDFMLLTDALEYSEAYLAGLSDSSATIAGRKVAAADVRRVLELLRREVADGGQVDVAFMDAHFQAYRTRPAGESGKSTGYFEPVVPARLERSDAFNWPIYGPPDPRKKPEDTREQIVFDGSLAGRAEPIAYLPTPVDVSILHIQGSAVLDLGDGTIGRVNYHSANGHPYRAIGRKLLDVIPRGEMSIQSIKQYLLDHPSRWREVLSYDASYVFLRKVGLGPIGTIQQVVTSERSIAVDQREVPLGALCFVRIPSLGIGRLVLAQDTGGAIKGPGRLDFFRGTGEQAALRAGPMNESADLYVLMPKAPERR